MPVTTETIIELLPLPVFILIPLACMLYLGGAMKGSGASRLPWGALSLATYAGAALALIGRHWSKWGPRFGELTEIPLNGPLAIDFFSQSMAWLAVLTGALFTAIAMYQAPRNTSAEYYASLMVVSSGIMLVGAANDLVLLFVGLEMVSIPTYILLYLGRADRAGSEAAAKYFFLSILSSALLLYGMSFLYGMGQTTIIAGGETLAGSTVVGLRENLSALSQEGDGLASLAPIAMVLIFAGLGFKIAAAPFHFYAPDVYQGLTNANAGLLAVGPKIAAMAALVKLSFVAVSGLQTDLIWQLGLVTAILTMTVGNVCALWQNNLRRLLAYSSIAHSGYMLMGLTAAAAGAKVGAADVFTGGVSAIMFYLLVYALATGGAFAVLSFLSSPQHEVGGLKELAALGRFRPLSAAALAICLLSLTGIPPLAGFWGKFSLFNSTIAMALAADGGDLPLWMSVLAVAGALNAAVAAAYYLKIVAVMYFGEPTTSPPAQGGAGARAAFVFCTIMVLLVGALPGTFTRQADLAERSFLRQGGGPQRAAVKPSPQTISRE